MATTTQVKKLVIKKFGWKRVAKNVMRFGWDLDNAVEHVDTTVTTNYEERVVGDTVYLDQHDTTKTKVRIHLDFHRNKDKFENLKSVSVLEVFYNLIFTLRRLVGFCLPFLLIAAFVVAIIGQGGDEGFTELWTAFGISFAVWALFIILEGVFARISAKILKLK